jgi:UDP-N-acetylmuramate-alanine ligase
VAVIAPVFHRALLGENVLDREALVARLRARGIQAEAPAEGTGLTPFIRSRLRGGDVVLCMSSGDFGGLPRQLVTLLKEGP